MNGSKRYVLPPLAAVLAGALVLPAYAAPESAGSADELVTMPIAENQECMTYRGVRMQGNLRATDPDGGALTYEIVERPKKGTVALDEENSAVFVYTPAEGKTGRDSFTFCVRDEDGNVSAPATVKMEILKGKTDVRYADMEDDPAHAAAVRLAEEGVYTGRKMGASYFFDPETPVTRGEFLAMTMTAAGIDSRADVIVTGFGDDESIPTWAKGYASAAQDRGVVTGKPSGGEVFFSADEPITYSEAATILNRVMAITDVDAAAFSDSGAPAWAVQSVANLSSVDVLPGGADYGAKLNRAAAAQMLCAAMDLMDTRQGGPLGWLK